jgi:hypothetical protein
MANTAAMEFAMSFGCFGFLTKFLLDFKLLNGVGQREVIPR